MRSTGEKNAPRMLRKTPGSGEQVASVRLLRGDESADRCLQALGTSSRRCPLGRAGPQPPGSSPGLGLPGRGDQSCREAARPVSLRAAHGAHAAARTRGPSPPCRGASWRQIACRRPAAAHQFPEPTMHTFRGDAAMARAKRRSPARASPAGRWPPPAQPHPQLLPTAPPLPPLPPLHQWPRPPPPASARPRRTPRQDPPRHSREPLRTPGPRCTSGPAPEPPHPCPRHAGTCSTRPCGRALRWTAPPTVPRAAGGGDAA